MTPGFECNFEADDLFLDLAGPWAKTAIV